MRRSVLLAGALALLAYGQAPVITPSQPAVGQGSTMQFQANKPVTWSLRPGSAGTISATGLYTAPAKVQVKHKAGPCQMLPPDHVYATRIDSLPVHPRSSAIMAINNGDFRIGFEPSFWTNVTTNTSPTFVGNFYYTPQNNGTFRVLEWPQLKAETGVFMPYFNNTDNHEVYVNRDNCEFTDIYNRYPAGTNTLQNCPLCTAQSGVTYKSDFVLPTTGATDAAGMAQQPVSMSLADIQSGEIQHALRFSMSNSYIKPSFIWPATANAVPFCLAALVETNGCYEYGMYVRLKSSHNISTYSPTAQIILTALKRYGMVLTDGGSNYAIQTNANVTMDYAVREALNEIFFGNLRSGDFEVVNTTPYKISDASGAVALGTEFVPPSQYAEVIATDASNNVTTMRVNLRGVTVGVPEPVMTIWSGHTVNLTAWVTGAADTSVTWSMSPSVGTLSASTGAYTAPNNLTSPTRVRFTAASVADPTSTALIDAILWPKDDGTMRLDLGHTGSDFIDINGKKWWRDDWAPVEGFGGVWGGGPASSVYAETRYYYNDGRLKWYLPNGHYKARIYMSVNTEGGPIQPDEFVCHVDSQGQIYRHDFSVGRVTNYSRYTGGYLDVPMDVTDGSAYLALRYRGPNTIQNIYCSWAAVEISPDASAPRLEIESGKATGDITLQQTRQFYAAAWFMANTVTWSIVSGPGTISPAGLYTAPSTPPSATQPVVIRATSTVDPDIFEQTTFNFVFGQIVIAPIPNSAVSRGLQQQFTASINGLPYTNVVWSLEDGSAGTISPTGLYTSPASVPADAPLIVKATSTDDPTKSATVDLTLLKSIVPIRINCGSTTPFTDAKGQVWAADYGFSGDTQTYSDGQAQILNTTPDMWPLYQSSRYRYTNEDFSYQFAVPNGHYRVTLKWAEYRGDNQGMRMDVRVEGARVLRNFDPVAAAGDVRVAHDRTFVVPVTDGVLNLNFSGKADAVYVGAAINGIEILEEPGPIQEMIRGKVRGKSGAKLK